MHRIASIAFRTATLLLAGLPAIASAQDFSDTIAPAQTTDPSQTIDPGQTIDASSTRHPSRTIDAHPAIHPSQTIDARPAIHPSQTIDARPAIHPSQTIHARPATHPSQTISQPEPAYMQPFGVSARVLTCESRGHGYKRCAAPSGTVRLQQQLSGAACQEGRDWGWDHGAVWVNNGCRATFIVD